MRLKKVQICKLVWVSCFTLIIVPYLGSIQNVTQTYEQGLFILVLLGLLSFPLGPLLLYFVTILQLIEYQNNFVLELIVISVSCFIGGYAQWFIILPRIIKKYWN